MPLIDEQTKSYYSKRFLVQFVEHEEDLDEIVTFRFESNSKVKRSHHDGSLIFIRMLSKNQPSSDSISCSPLDRSESSRRSSLSSP